jgi:dihydrolipoyl dehydrogenase
MDGSRAQLAVVGAGPGGYAAAFLAADLGMQVTLIDPEADPGGVCLYRGCIPSKALLHVAKVIGDARDAARWGVAFQEPAIDLDRLRVFKDGVVKKLTSGLGQLCKARQVTYLRGRARFTGAGRLEVALHGGGTQRVDFETAIVATGSTPSMLPGLPRDPRLIDSTGALDLPDRPARMLVIGGGYIGLELGSVYATLGSKVTVVEMTAGLLPGVDRDLVRPLARRLETLFEEVLLETRVARLTAGTDGLKAAFEGKGVAAVERTFDRVLVSVGRRPATADLGLDATGVQIDRAGFLQVDGKRRTADPRIYAIGDAAGQPMLAHKASHEGRAAVEAIAGRNVVYDPAAVPAVVFTDPEIAWCGLTETQAEAEGRRVEVARFPWAASGRAVTIDRTEGVTKLLIDPDSERVLGVGLAGSGAGELIAEGVLAVEMAATASDVALTMHPHPTLSETIMESAELFFGQSTHLYRKKKRQEGGDA